MTASSTMDLGTPKSAITVAKTTDVIAKAQVQKVQVQAQFQTQGLSVPSVEHFTQPSLAQAVANTNGMRRSQQDKESADPHSTRAQMKFGAASSLYSSFSTPKPAFTPVGNPLDNPPDFPGDTQQSSMAGSKGSNTQAQGVLESLTAKLRNAFGLPSDNGPALNPAAVGNPDALLSSPKTRLVPSEKDGTQKSYATRNDGQVPQQQQVGSSQNVLQLQKLVQAAQKGQADPFLQHAAGAAYMAYHARPANNSETTSRQQAGRNQKNLSNAKATVRRLAGLPGFYEPSTDSPLDASKTQFKEPPDSEALNTAYRRAKNPPAGRTTRRGRRRVETPVV